MQMVKTLVSGPATQKREFFTNHVEPLEKRIEQIHKDYMEGFQEIRRHLKDGTAPTSDLMDFLKERRRVGESERFLARDLAQEMDKARKTGMNLDLWTAVMDYCNSILKYLSATASVGGFSWYTNFIHSVESAIRVGVGRNVWHRMAYSNDAQADLLNAVDDTLDHHLPRAFESVSASYANLRARLL